jgi:hypothetical protein
MGGGYTNPPDKPDKKLHLVRCGVGSLRVLSEAYSAHCWHLACATVVVNSKSTNAAAPSISRQSDSRWWCAQQTHMTTSWSTILANNAPRLCDNRSSVSFSTFFSYFFGGNLKECRIPHSSFELKTAPPSKKNIIVCLQSQDSLVHQRTGNTTTWFVVCWIVVCGVP